MGGKIVSEKQILVVIKEPGKEAAVEPLFDNTLEAFQKAVGGYIETLTIAKDLVLIVNEEGRIQNLPFNTSVLGTPLYGTILAVGVRGDEFASVKGSCVSAVLKMLNGGYVR
jgi:hypothetical protein